MFQWPEKEEWFLNPPHFSCCPAKERRFCRTEASPQRRASCSRRKRPLTFPRKRPASDPGRARPVTPCSLGQTSFTRRLGRRTKTLLGNISICLITPRNSQAVLTPCERSWKVYFLKSYTHTFWEVSSQQESFAWESFSRTWKDC